MGEGDTMTADELQARIARAEREKDEAEDDESMWLKEETLCRNLRVDANRRRTYWTAELARLEALTPASEEEQHQ